MDKWNKQLEDELTLLIKDWLKQKRKTQKDLHKLLGSSSERIPSLLEKMKAEYREGGLPYLAKVLCEIEAQWGEGNESNKQVNNLDPFSQLDLLLEEIEEDCSA